MSTDSIPTNRMLLLSDGVEATASSDRCTICLSEFDASNDDHPVKVKACGHVFGKKCLGEWVKSRNSCPMCRHVLFLQHSFIEMLAEIEVEATQHTDRPADSTAAPASAATTPLVEVPEQWEEFFTNLLEQLREDLDHAYRGFALAGQERARGLIADDDYSCIVNELQRVKSLMLHMIREAWQERKRRRNHSCGGECGEGMPEADVDTDSDSESDSETDSDADPEVVAGGDGSGEECAGPL